MALFGKTTKEEVKKEGSKTASKGISATKASLLSPRVTEKSAILAESGTYVFEVEKDSTKNEIKKEIERVYKVKPVKVHTVNLPRKKVNRQKSRGFKGGVKKAYVTLKEGDRIEIF